MTLNTLPLFALRITSLYLFSLYLDEARYHRSTPDMEILREKRNLKSKARQEMQIGISIVICVRSGHLLAMAAMHGIFR
ncbi:hypothetical protein ACS0PU_008165 [Formica fusca]